MVYIPPTKLAFEEWIQHGYVSQPSLDEAEPCIICGMTNNACTGEEHGIAQGPNYSQGYQQQDPYYYGTTA